MPNLNKLMKQAAKMQEQMQRQMEETQNQLAQRTVETSSGGGAVKVVAKCDGSVVSVKIEKEAIDPEDAEMLEDMIITAVNSALAEAKQIADEEMAKVSQQGMQGLNLPGMPGLF